MDVLVVGISGIVRGIDRARGKELWENKLPGGGGGEVALAISDTLIFASADGNRLFALDYPSGKTVWVAETSAAGRASIVIDGEHIFVGKQGRVDCFRLDGYRIWSAPLPGAGFGRIGLGFPGNVVQADDAGTR